MHPEDETQWMDLAVEAGTLREAMVTRASIEQAKGVLMGLRRCSADQAFAELRAVSQGSNTKLHVIAETLLAAVANRPPEHPHVRATILASWAAALRVPTEPVVGSQAEHAWNVPA
jgi:hypothetical protein